jgi:ankyrin repeat protein
MQLTTKSMDIDSKYLNSISEDNHQEGKEENNDNIQTISSSSSISFDRTLNQKFHVAALTGNLNILQELLTKSHIPIDCRDKENSTALLLSCAHGHYSCVEYLLINGADPNARRITGASPLYFATSYNHTRICLIMHQLFVHFLIMVLIHY